MKILSMKWGCKTIKRGRGVACKLSERFVFINKTILNNNSIVYYSQPFGYAVPICTVDLKKSFCECEGKFSDKSIMIITMLASIEIQAQ
jgi:hypothetical protein